MIVSSPIRLIFRSACALSLSGAVAHAAGTTPAPAEPAISVQTALFIIMGGGFFFCIKLLLDLRNRIEALESKGSQDSQTTSVAQSSGGEGAEDAVTGGELAAIMAAVAETCGDGFRIISLEHHNQHQQPLHDNSAWSLDGRRRIFDTRRAR